MLTAPAPVRAAAVEERRDQVARRGAPGPPPEGADTYVAATVALTALTIVSAVGLVRVFSGHRWLLPVLITAAAVHGVCWAARRARVPQPVAVLIALVAVWILAGWTVLGSSTTYGFPGGRTATQMWSALGQARTDFSSAVTPAVATTGFTLIAVLATGLVAWLADWAAFRWRSALYGAAAPFAYFVACCALGAGSGREWAVTVEVAALLVFLLAHRATVGRNDQAWFGNHRAGAARWAITAGGVAAVLALLAAVAVTPAVGKTEGRGILGWRGGIGQAGSGPRQVPNPIVDLHARLLEQTNTAVFRVQSTVPSYWRLTSLDTFTGQDWISTNSYRGFGPRLPGVQGVPAGTRTVHEQFSVQALGSVWLPDAFTPVAVHGVRNVSYDPTSGSLITSHPTSNGLSYSVDSYQYLSSLDASQLRAAPPVVITSGLRRYVQLPTLVPPSVYALARSITAGQTTEYGKALALQNFFLGSPFVYNLNPADNGYGIDSLTNFLFVTHSGFCQQFAGSYAVLARAIGLPTRLAVGFATGTAGANHTYQVVNADAHTWPEVYFGPQYGWLPFEPTKSKVDPASQGYAPALAGAGGAGQTTPGPASSPLPRGIPQPNGQAPGKRITTPTSTARVQATGGSHGHGAAIWSGLLLALGAVIAWTGVVTAFRRARWSARRWRARRDPGAVVLSYWADVSEMLNWWGAGRRAGETDEEFARRAARLLARRLREPSPWLPGGILRLAHLATEAAFARQVPTERAGEAAQVAREIHQRLFRSATARQLAVWAVRARPGRRAEPGFDPVRTRPTADGQLLRGPWPASAAGGR